jgi:Kef-type K+ transport system membrane component KefB
MPLDSTFAVIAAVLVVAALAGAFGAVLRQPLIVVFIAVGVLVGPVGLGWVEAESDVVILADLGIAILLFLVGLRLDLSLIRTTGRVAVVTGLGQVIFTSVIGFGLALWLGLDPIPALYVAVALTFSSTIIIVKLLSDKRELDQPHGRIAVGFLIVQDLVVVLVMISLSTFVGQDASFAEEIGLVVVKGVAFLAGIAAVTRLVLPRVLPLMARSPELLILGAIAWAVALAAIGDALGFSREVGAFLAGVSLASTPFREAIGARLVGLRDFLLLFFFIDLGARIEVSDFGGQIGAALLLSLFVLIGNPLIVMVLMGAMRYRKQVGFLAGLTVAQISEFSLILVALGLSLGHIGTDTVSLVTIVGLVTIGLSTYLILNSHALYRRLSPALSVFERRSPRDLPGEDPTDTDVIILGAGRYGSALAADLQHNGAVVLAVDHDPASLECLDDRGVATLYGDAEEPEFAFALPLDQAAWVVSTLPRVESTLAALHGLKAAGYTGHVAAAARSAADSELLESAGVERVLLPFESAAHEAARTITRALPQPAAEPVRRGEASTAGSQPTAPPPAT